MEPRSNNVFLLVRALLGEHHADSAHQRNPGEAFFRRCLIEPRDFNLPQLSARQSPERLVQLFIPTFLCTLHAPSNRALNRIRKSASGINTTYAMSVIRREHFCPRCIETPFDKLDPKARGIAPAPTSRH
jgi:hypothetical protein